MNTKIEFCKIIGLEDINIARNSCYSITKKFLETIESIGLETLFDPMTDEVHVYITIDQGREFFNDEQIVKFNCID